jgi:hypothetical protein
MLICNKCGKVIAEEDLTSHKDLLSYYGDEPYYEEFADNCSCGGDFVEAVKCDCCEEYYLDEEIYTGWRFPIKVCTNCLDYYKGKYAKAYKELDDTDEFIDWLADNGDIK